MALFLSTFINKIDNKGRVSIPAQFRAFLNVEGINSVVLYESFINNCIEGCNLLRIKKLCQSIDNLDPFSEERDAFATSILGGSVQVSIDSDGRIIIPQTLLQKAAIKENAVFVGKGSTFEIWEVESFNQYLQKSKEIAKEKRALLRLAGDGQNDK